MNMWLRVLVLVPLVAGFSLSGVASKLRGDGHITDALGNDIDTHGQWWTPNDRDVFKGNMGINKYQPPSVKSFTDAGFKKLKIPGDLWTGIKTFFDKNRNNAINEGTVPGYIVGKTTWMTYIDGDLRDRVFSTMKPILSDWAGVPLAESAVYGIRKYTNGSSLQVHVDSKGTHIISAILHVHEEYHSDKEEHWPLQIIDHQQKVHEVLLQPGEMVLYESAKLIHGRPKPFQGKGYWNLFCHFRPANNEHLEI